MKAKLIILATATVVLFVGCTPWANVRPTAWAPRDNDPVAVPSCAIAAARTLSVQTRDVNLDELKADDPDVVAIDFLAGAGDCGDLTAAQVKSLRERPEDPRGNRIVLAYLNIGKADHYRIVWQPDGPDGKCVKSLMIRVDPQLDDDSPIDFTNPGWKQALAAPQDSYIQRIVALGFDGVLLDGIGAVRDESWAVKPEAAASMFDLVKAIAESARAVKPDFAVVVGDAVAFSGIQDSTSVMTGVFAKNIIMYNGYVRPESEMKPTLEALNGFRKAGLPVMSVEFIEDSIQQTHYQNICMKMGYLCFITDQYMTSPGLLVEAGNGGSCTSAPRPDGP